ELDAAVLLLLRDDEERGVRTGLRVGVRDRCGRRAGALGVLAVAEDDLPRDELTRDRRAWGGLDRQRVLAARRRRRQVQDERRAAADRHLRARGPGRVLPRRD